MTLSLSSWTGRGRLLDPFPEMALLSRVSSSERDMENDPQGRFLTRTLRHAQESRFITHVGQLAARSLPSPRGGTAPGAQIPRGIRARASSGCGPTPSLLSLWCVGKNDRDLGHKQLATLGSQSTPCRLWGAGDSCPQGCEERCTCLCRNHWEQRRLCGKSSVTAT